mgnify:CR=1 FL=1
MVSEMTDALKAQQEHNQYLEHMLAAAHENMETTERNTAAHVRLLTRKIERAWAGKLRAVQVRTVWNSTHGRVLHSCSSSLRCCLTDALSLAAPRVKSVAWSKRSQHTRRSARPCYSGFPTGSGMGRGRFEAD